MQAASKTALNRSHLDGKDWFILVGLAALWCLVASRHELGHDEAQAWNIARSAEAWLEVIWHSRHEGHTPLWFALLWPFTRTGNPIFMQIIAIALCALVAGLLLRSKTFPRYVSVLILIGYFIGYEYAVLSRPYTVALTLCAIFACLLSRRGLSSYLWLCLVCSLLGFTSSFSLLLSAALMLLLLVEVLLADDQTRPRFRVLALGVLIYTVIALAAVYYIIFPFEGRSFESEMLTGQRVNVLNWSKAIETAAFPHFNRLPFGIGHWLTDTESGKWSLLILTLGAIFAVLIKLLERPAAAISWLAALVLVTTGTMISGLYSERQMGHLLMAALVLFWVRPVLSTFEHLPKPIAKAWGMVVRATETTRLSLFAAYPIVGLLLYQASIGVGAAAMDITRPLTSWKQVHAYLESNQTEPFLLITDHAYNAGALLAKLDMPAFNMRCQCWTRYGVWQGSKINASRDLYAEQLREAWCELKDQGDRVLILRTTNYWPEDASFKRLAEFPKGYRDSSHWGPELYEVEGAGDEVCGLKGSLSGL